MGHHPCALLVLGVAACSGRSAPAAGDDPAPLEPTVASSPPAGSATTPAAPAAPYDTAHLLADLRGAGIVVDPATGTRPLTGTVSRGGATCALPGAVTSFRVHGEIVHAYELPDEAAARAAVARVGCAGDTIDGCILEWNSDPHYFVRGRLVVEHVGSENAAQALRVPLGAPVAGEGSACLAHLRSEAARATDQIARGDVGTIRGVARNARGRATDLLVVRVHREGWMTTARTGWAPGGTRRRHGELLVEGVPAGHHVVDVTRDDSERVLWTGEVDVVAGRTIDLDVRVP